MRLLNLYEKHFQEYTPKLFWPSITIKFRRMFARSVETGDEAGFIKDFCLLNAIWGIGSQLSDDPEVRHESGDQFRNGWRFFELARNFHNLVTANYDLADATITLLMS